MRKGRNRQKAKRNCSALIGLQATEKSESRPRERTKWRKSEREKEIRKQRREKKAAPMQRNEQSTEEREQPDSRTEETTHSRAKSGKTRGNTREKKKEKLVTEKLKTFSSNDTILRYSSHVHRSTFVRFIPARRATAKSLTNAWELYESLHGRTFKMTGILALRIADYIKSNFRFKRPFVFALRSTSKSPFLSDYVIVFEVVCENCVLITAPFSKSIRAISRDDAS